MNHIPTAHRQRTAFIASASAWLGLITLFSTASCAPAQPPNSAQGAQPVTIASTVPGKTVPAAAKQASAAPENEASIFADSPLTPLADRFVRLANAALEGRVDEDAGIPIPEVPAANEIVRSRGDEPLPKSVQFVAFGAEIQAVVTMANAPSHDRVRTVVLLTDKGMKVGRLSVSTRTQQRDIARSTAGKDLPSWLRPIHETFQELQELSAGAPGTFPVFGQNDMTTFRDTPAASALIRKSRVSSDEVRKLSKTARSASTNLYSLDDMVLLGFDDKNQLWRFKFDLDMERGPSGNYVPVFDSRPIMRASTMKKRRARPLPPVQVLTQPPPGPKPANP